MQRVQKDTDYFHWLQHRLLANGPLWNRGRHFHLNIYFLKSLLGLLAFAFIQNVYCVPVNNHRSRFLKACTRCMYLCLLRRMYLIVKHVFIYQERYTIFSKEKWLSHSQKVHAIWSLVFLWFAHRIKSVLIH